MGLFGFGTKRQNVVDLAESYRQKKEKEAAEQAEKKDTGFSFFEPDSEEISTEPLDSGTAEERRKRLAKRLVDMTNKLDDLSNKIYHLQQRIELLEQKTNIIQPKNEEQV